MTGMLLTSADESMRAAVDRLLAANGLVALEAGPQFEDRRYVAALLDGELIGIAGFEMHEDAALLRSVAVDGEFRGEGVGQALVAETLGLAEAAGARTVYLLTETAGDFFPRFGFEAMGRGDAPAGIAGTREWSEACGERASAMRLVFGDGSRE